MDHLQTHTNTQSNAQSNSVQPDPIQSDPLWTRKPSLPPCAPPSSSMQVYLKREKKQGPAEWWVRLQWLYRQADLPEEAQAALARAL